MIEYVKNLISKERYNTLSQKAKELELKFNEEMQNMGIDEA